VLGDSMEPKRGLVCRLCATPTEDGVEIYSERGVEGCLPEKISKCLPILVSVKLAGRIPAIVWPLPHPVAAV
jgi:hypothetical protein